VERAKAFNEEEAGSTPTDIISPTDNLPLIETLRAYRSQDGKLVIYKTMGNRKLELEEVRELMTKGTIGPIDSFRSKMGKPFSAMLKFDAEENKVKFVFESSGGDSDSGMEGVDLTTFPPLGSCPLCNEGKVREAPSSYVCDRYKKEGGCKFRISRMILGKAIPSDQFLKLITDQKTDLLEGFRSNRTKRLFSAHLILKEGSTIGFEFAPRAPKATKKTTKKAAKRKSKDERVAEETTDE
jgi:DNA topoisomerase-3